MEKKKRKNRSLRFRFHELKQDDILSRIADLDGKALLLWLKYRLDNLIVSGYFHSITLEESTLDYFCRMIVRYDHQFDDVTIFYKERRFV